ncbi:flavohemoglobin expression-modulating QEGLA motif protein [Photobacterium lipolyticum]|uniref:Flavohemoglobin expression-modulating QEGLA motif protein n=1 Tax=Photobacterium lipolyticum TaxID=266810 RepID=A0A2T3N1Z1_9GAMM|nr:flavohemoglobin expression-modulating QEGLA motif protein [Photobacterium lipolyticum]PSW06332.1 flavohemoglobin expression-modulating QEGLA motif protein [Photobacterium lipolyticum]
MDEIISGKQPARVLTEIDDRLCNLVQDLDILSSVTPSNYKQERERFFAQHYSIEPNFCYQSNPFDVHQAKRALYELPVEKILNDDLKLLYTDIIQSYADKLDQLCSIGENDFLYNSLRYYGEPSIKDIKNANFLLHLPNEEEETASYDAIKIEAFMRDFAEQHGYEYNLIISDNMIANALVVGNNVKINSAAKLSGQELNALAHHELGVHLLTTLNARSQPLKLLNLGCPVNTTTQEGLAILCEFLSGHFSIKRLRTLALRVVAVESMIKERDFRSTFLLLKEHYNTDDLTAFTITARVYRGGGFTKDYLYLKGFSEILNAYNEMGSDFNYLLCGKTELKYIPQIKRLIAQDILLAPKLISPAITDPQVTNPIYQFVTQALR